MLTFMFLTHLSKAPRLAPLSTVTNMRISSCLVLVSTTIAAASTWNCSVFDDGNFQRTCDTESFHFVSHMGMNVTCLQYDGKSNLTTTLMLSNCIGYNLNETKLEWRIPPQCDTTISVEQGIYVNTTSTQGQLSVLPFTP